MELCPHYCNIKHYYCVACHTVILIYITAPEVLYCQEYDHSADWWTLGILMYALLMGEFPINGPRDHREMGAAVARYTYGLPDYFKTEAKTVIGKVHWLSIIDTICYISILVLVCSNLSCSSAGYAGDIPFHALVIFI